MTFLLSPVALAIPAGAMVVLIMRRSHRAGLLAASVLLLPLLLLMTPLGANQLVRLVEASGATRVSTEPPCREPDAIVLLSGGMQRPAASTTDFAALTAETLDRVFAFTASGVPGDTPVIVSGGGPFRVAEAEIIAALMRHLVPKSIAPRLESGSTTTRTSAAAVARMLPAGERRVVLATSALHVSRARLAFERNGFEVCPWPLTSRYIPVYSPAGLWPQSSAIHKSEQALHELAGLHYYRLRYGFERLTGAHP